MTFRIALAQLDPTVGDIDGNTQLVRAAWQRAADVGADLIVFPELVITGYPPDDLLFKPEFVAANEAAVERLAAEGPHGTTAIVGYARRAPATGDEAEWDVTVAALDDLRNSAAVLRDGEIVGTYDKARLPNYGVFDEGRYFTPSDDPLVVEVAGVPVGVTICEDLWSESGPVAEAIARGARLIANCNASPFHLGKPEQRDRWIRHHTTTGGVHLAYVNVVGGQDELVFDGDSAVHGPDGEAVARAAQFRDDLLVVDLDVEGATGGDDRPPIDPRQPEERLDEVAAAWHALVLATRDYCRKNGFTQATLGLSGGIDSSVVAAIAVEALGADNVLGVSMPSKYSTEHSKTDAEQLADNLGMRFETIEIVPGMEAFDEMLKEQFAGTEMDVAEENIQARLRGMLLMAISNKFGHLVLATGNKSEGAVGYATLYGDMAGGFMPLKDCYKHLVYDLARYCNRAGERIPTNAIDKEPSAELRPDQRDEDSLPPYEVLDAVLEAYIEEGLGVAAIVERGYDEAVVREIVRMVDRAEYKRRQAPPGVKISEKAFGRDRRLPITNGWRT